MKKKKMKVSAFYDEYDMQKLCEFFGEEYNEEDYIFTYHDPIARAIALHRAKVFNWEPKEVQHVTLWTEKQVKKKKFKKRGMKYDPSKYTYELGDEDERL